MYYYFLLQKDFKVRLSGLLSGVRQAATYPALDNAEHFAKWSQSSGLRKAKHCGNAGPEGTYIDIAKGVVYKL